MKTRFIVPVDLNSLLYRSARLLSEFSSQLGDAGRADTYRQQAETLRNNIQNVLWDQEAGSWFDYDTKNMVRATTDGGRLLLRQIPASVSDGTYRLIFYIILD